MVRKDYILIASILKDLKISFTTKDWNYLVDTMCFNFKSNHSSFNEQKFRKACAYIEPVKKYAEINEFEATELI